MLTDVIDSKIEERSVNKLRKIYEGGQYISIITCINKEGNWILQIIISYEEKHGVDDEISLSSI